ncbi:MAG TPA: AraC family transcriptional regulator [Pseudonocardiaceae bacterium]|nr:AraC family transcriptional regulator [Pseudonocardiaceae bacterium]
MSAHVDPPLPVPFTRAHFETREAGQFEQRIRDIYANCRLNIVGNHRDLHYHQSSVSAGKLTVDSVRCTMRTANDIDPIDYLMFLLPMAGRYALRTGSEEYRLDRGDPLVYPTGVPMFTNWDGTELRVLRLPLDTVAQVAARSGLNPAEFRLDANRPVSPAAGRHWRDTVLYLHRTLMAPQAQTIHSLVYDAMVEMAAASIIATFPNNLTNADPAPTGRAAPATLRRAVAYIDAHAHQSIVLTDIAAAARVGPRGLQAAFGRHLGLTPLAYLRRVRLEHAHRELKAADPTRGATVAEIAARWGFAKPQRFARYYREHYGVLPSHTLRT